MAAPAQNQHFTGPVLITAAEQAQGAAPTSNDPASFPNTGLLIYVSGNDVRFVKQAAAGVYAFRNSADSANEFTIDDNGNSALAGIVYDSSADSITAGSTQTQAGATLLTKKINRVTVVATAGDGVRLPASAAGALIAVLNADSADAMRVYGAGTDTINGVATATGVLQQANTLVIYACTTAGAWMATEVPYRELNTAITTAGAGTLTAAAIVGGVITRTGPTAAVNDTVDTAANIIAAKPGLQIGDSWEMIIKNLTAFPITVVTATGVTLSGQVIIPALCVARFLVTVASATTVTIQGLSIGNVTEFPANQYSTSASGAFTPTVAQHVGSQLVVLNLTGTSGNLTTETAANIIAAMPNAQIGQSYRLRIISVGSGTWTVLAGSGVTITGTATIAINTWREYIVTYTAAGTVVFQNIGAGTV